MFQKCARTITVDFIWANWSAVAILLVNQTRIK
jgi:hypothetical protein